LRRLLYPERFGPQQALVEFSTTAAPWLDRESLANALSESIKKMASFRNATIAMRGSGGHWTAFGGSGKSKKAGALRPCPEPAIANELAGWFGERTESVVAEDLERATDRFAQKSPAIERSERLAKGLRGENIDLAVGAGDNEGRQVLFLFHYSSKRQRLGEQTLATLEALAAEAASSLARQDLMEKARRAERLATVGEMASNIAHEIKNPLSAIRGAAQTLLADPQGAQSAELAEIIGSETTRLDTIVNEFLTFSRETPLELSHICLNELAQKTLKVCALRDDFSQIEIKTELADALPKIEIDEEKLHQTLLNLIGNAVEALDGEGAITIRTQSEIDHQILEVKDNGPGIPKETLVEIFEPLFTTKPRGTGLGLAISRKIIEAHGGTISCLAKTQETNGATFQIRLPASA